MAYRPSNNPIPSDPKALSEWIRSEFLAVSRAHADRSDGVHLNVMNKAPNKPRDGMIVEADGVNFNPGSGAGLYIRRGGVWKHLG